MLQKSKVSKCVIPGAVDSRLIWYQASISQLSLLKEHSAALFALVRETARPVSSTQQPSKSIEERVIELEKSDQSATKEITNIVAWLKRMDTNQPQGGALKPLETRVKELSDSSKVR